MVEKKRNIRIQATRSKFCRIKKKKKGESKGRWEGRKDVLSKQKKKKMQRVKSLGTSLRVNRRTRTDQNEFARIHTSTQFNPFGNLFIQCVEKDLKRILCFYNSSVSKISSSLFLFEWNALAADEIIYSNPPSNQLYRKRGE